MAKMSAVITTPVVTRKENTASLKVTALAVPVVMPLKGSMSKIPTSAPASASSTDSIMKEVRMLGFEKPRIRRVAISRERYATAAYMVFIAAKDEPTAMKMATMTPMNL